MDYFRPETLDQAVRALADGARVLAGGTDLYPGAGSKLAGPVVDLSDLPGIGGISTSEEGVRIGAFTTWTAIAEAALPPACHALQQAAVMVGGRQVQNTGTIGGNLCNASPAADGVPPLLVLGAEVELVGPNGGRQLALQDFLLGPRKVALAAGEVMVAVHLPQSGLAGVSAFRKLGARAHLVISIVSVAVRLVVRGDRINSAAVAVGSCSTVPLRLPGVEAALCGPVDGAAARVDPVAVANALSPIDDIRATAAYRRQAAAELVRRAVRAVL